MLVTHLGRALIMPASEQRSAPCLRLSEPWRRYSLRMAFARAGCTHGSWALYGGRKPAPPRRRPARPDPSATTAELESRFPELVGIMRERTAQYGGDGSTDTAVYQWESECLGDLDHSGQLSLEQARDYCGRLWRTYAPSFEPYFTASPTICVMSGADVVGGARAQALHHRVLIDEKYLRRTWLAHEVMHLLHVREQDGPGWCAGMIRLWSNEFGVDRDRALGLAGQHGVAVGLASAERAGRHGIASSLSDLRVLRQ